jgi:hypothetical protein
MLERTAQRLWISYFVKLGILWAAYFAALWTMKSWS